MRVPPWDLVMLRWADGFAVAPTVATHHGSVRVLDGRAFIRALGTTAPDPSAADLEALLPTAEVGTPEEAEQAAALTIAALGPGRIPLPRTDGLNFI